MKKRYGTLIKLVLGVLIVFTIWVILLKNKEKEKFIVKPVVYQEVFPDNDSLYNIVTMLEENKLASKSELFFLREQINEMEGLIMEINGMLDAEPYGKKISDERIEYMLIYEKKIGSGLSDINSLFEDLAKKNNLIKWEIDNIELIIPSGNSSCDDNLFKSRENPIIKSHLLRMLFMVKMKEKKLLTRLIDQSQTNYSLLK